MCGRTPCVFRPGISLLTILNEEERKKKNQKQQIIIYGKSGNDGGWQHRAVAAPSHLTHTAKHNSMFAARSLSHADGSVWHRFGRN